MAENWRKFVYTGDSYLILMRKKEYSRTESGKSWRKNPDNVECCVYDAEHYTNYITAIPFFNNFGDGAYCRGRRNYTCAGYLPTEVVSVGPFNCKKVVAEFEFISKREMLEKAGWREKEVMAKAQRYERMNQVMLDQYGGSHYSYQLTLITDDKGVTESATWDSGRKEWVD